MSRKVKRIFGWVIAILALTGVVYAGVYYNNMPGPLDGFATCIKDSGTKFYGAFWCPHCQIQKTEFGRSARLLPYIECSMPDGQTQTPTCNEQKIDSYPTWEFSDGSRETGEQSLAFLAEKTKCALPAKTP